MRRAGAAMWMTACLALAACMPKPPGLPMWIDVPKREGLDPRAGSFRAGAHAVDITPIPGVPLGGHSIDGKASRGFWTRLRARAVYLADARGTPLVLVSTDLGAIPGGLGDEVIRLLHREHKRPWIGREHLVLAATHTHHGPGNFYTEELWNGTISPWQGFEAALFQFLARGIASAIAEAEARAVPADLLATDASALDASKQWKIDDLFRNRSLPAFLLNPQAKSLLDPNVSPNCAPWPDDPHPDPRVCTAIRPKVELLVIRKQGGSEILALAAFAPVHATVLPSRLEVYSGDLFGVASTRLEQGSCAALGSGRVVAFFNGAEGDVSPAWTARDRDDVLRLGERLADGVCSLLGHLKPVSSPFIRFGFERVKLAKQTGTGEAIFDENQADAKAERLIPEKGSPGAAAAGGAEDGRSSLHEFLGHREGKTRVARREQGPKSPVGQVEGMGMDLDVLALWKKPAPLLVPLAVYRIGETAPNVVIAAIPGEMTTQMGARARQTVWEKLEAPPRPDRPDHVLLVGVANEYMGYFATPEEYDAQHYEGAMTLYGAESGPFVAQKLGELAAKVAAGSTPATPTDWTTPFWQPYTPGPRETFQPKDVWGPLHFKDDGLADLLIRQGDVRRDLPVFCWRDAVPRLETVLTGEMCKVNNPKVSVVEIPLSGLAEKVVADNEGLEFVTAVAAVGMGETEHHTEWCAIWLGAAERLEPTPTREFQFQVTTLEGASLGSKRFDLVDAGNDGWLDRRFLQHPKDPLVRDFPSCLVPMSNQCTVPGP